MVDSSAAERARIEAAALAHPVREHPLEVQQPDEVMIARSMTFRSSRTFPGHG